MTTINDIATIMTCLRNYFPNYNPHDSAQTSKALLLMLQDIPYQTLEIAVMSLCSEKRTFAPSAGEIRHEAVRIAMQVEKIPTVWDAYYEIMNMPVSKKVIDRTEKIGGVYERIIYKEVTWSHPLIEKIAEIIGWPKNFPTENPDNDRAQFNKIYESYLKKEIEQRNTLPLIKSYFLEMKNGRSPSLHKRIPQEE